jgi:hypothetical protein
MMLHELLKDRTSYYDSPMKPSLKDFASFELARGIWMNLWASGDSRGTRITAWSFFWASFAMHKLPKTWYRVYPIGKTPGDWRPMKPGASVLEETGFADDPDVLAEPPNDNLLGAAENLPKGVYVLQVKVRIGRKNVEVPGVTFRVS